MGPDHPQYEIYQTSKHGVVYATEGEDSAPSCSTCHMPHKLQDGNGDFYTDHDLSFGIAFGPVGGQPSHRSVRRGGQLPYTVSGGVLAPNAAFDPNALPDMTGADGTPDSLFPDDRDGTLVQVVDNAEVLGACCAEMVGVCNRCHVASYASERLEIADGMHENAHQVIDEASDILRALYFDGLLLPPTPSSPGRPNTPDAAIGSLVLGGPMLYRDLTAIERYYFKMYKYDFVKSWHGAYHMNPDYAHWYGWAEMNLTFSDIADEAYDTRQDYALKYAIEHGLSTVWQVPYQGVYWNIGSMTETFDLFPAGTTAVDANGSGVPTAYTGLTFH
jgi:hypothetical protein